MMLPAVATGNGAEEPPAAHDIPRKSEDQAARNNTLVREGLALSDNGSDLRHVTYK
jgi:hypothetical protein